MKRTIIKSVDNFENELGGKIVQKFIKNFKCEVEDFYARVGENPLYYREKKLMSIIFPALYKISPNVVLEHEFCQRIKEGNKRKSSRYLDVWFADKNLKNIFLIEFKHGWDYLNSDKIDTNSTNRWRNLEKQLDDITKEIVEEELRLENESNIYKVGLYFMPTFNNSEVECEFDAETYHKERKFNLFNNIEFSWIWKISNKLNEDINGEYWSIKYYNIFGKIEKLI